MSAETWAETFREAAAHIAMLDRDNADLRARLSEVEAERDDAAKNRDLYCNHATDGWNLANHMTRQWKEAEANVAELRGALERARPVIQALAKHDLFGPFGNLVNAARYVEDDITRALGSPLPGDGTRRGVSCAEFETPHPDGDCGAPGCPWTAKGEPRG